jgi:hypothetical protein
MDYTYINIDSKLISKKNSHSDFTYNLPNEIKNVIEINLSSIEIPNSSFLFHSNKDNTSFKFIINNNTYTFSIINGNYKLNTLYDLLHQFLLSIENANPGVILGIIYNPNSVKFKFTSNTLFSLDFTNIGSYDSFGKILGFMENKYNNVLEAEAENISNLNTHKYMLLRLSNYGNIVLNNNTYFSKIIVTKENYEQIYDSQFMFQTKKFIFKQPVDINKLDISIHDMNENIIDFNGINISLTLEIKSIRNKLFKKYYENFNYDTELMNLVLKDKMLTYFSNKVSNNNMIGKKLHDTMINIHNNKNNQGSSMIIEEKMINPNIIAINKHINKHINTTKHNINKIKSLKKKFKY